MLDCEEAEFFFAAEKRKRKKDKKHKSSMSVKTQESIPKKKNEKNLKFKEEMKKKKQKKKEKRERKLRLELEDALVLKDSCEQDTYFDKLEASYPHGNEPLEPDDPTPASKKKSKRKNKVLDASPRLIHIKRPKHASSFIREKDSVRDAESCSQVTGNSPDSQSTSDDINSQDLFITQKTFRKSVPGASRGEAGYGALTASPLLQTQRDSSQHPLLVDVKQFHEESDSQPHQLCVPSNPGEDKGLRKVHKKKKKSFLTQNTNLCEERSVSRPALSKPSVGNPFLDELVFVKSSWEAAEKKTGPPNQHSSLPHVDESRLPPTVTVSSSTQTENFFSAALSSYLLFCQKSRAAVCLEDLKPLDLSLPQRARRELCSPVLEVKGKGEAGGTAPSDSSHLKERRAASAGGETTPSPQFSGSDQKSSDTTTSSEDSEQPGRTGKLDLIQVRAVQMRLNESFFFKTKGERRSPRPASPLMKLAQGRDVKSRKSC